VGGWVGVAEWLLAKSFFLVLENIWQYERSIFAVKKAYEYY